MKNNNYCMALLAHVDAGKTTLSESILFNTGSIRRVGRVDHRDSFLDTETEERERGITVFSKQALFSTGKNRYTLIDTPGHTDFSAEMERVLAVLDFAVLIISAPDGIHGHDITLWKLLDIYKVPTIIFVNKCDQPGADYKNVMKELSGSFGSGTVDFGSNAEDEAFYEAIAELDESAMEQYFAKGRLDREVIAGLFRERRLFPVCGGSALKGQGTDRLLELMDYLNEEKEYPDTFSAKVFKLTHDARGSRLTHILITGGELKPKDTVRVNHRDGSEAAEEKADRILLYSGTGFEQLNRAEAGMAVCIDGINGARCGDTLGDELPGNAALMTALFASRVSSQDMPDAHKLYQLLKELETELPEISIAYNERLGEISIRLMGEMQTDIIRSIVRERYGIRLDFSEASVVYRETITEPLICAGHYEPLRHYAEVHLLLEPAEPGSGIEICSRLSEDVLSRNYQRQIMSELQAKQHIGALTGAELTDIRISLINGRAHEKHTEGGDFREAAWRAVRYGACRARAEGKAQLLEPYYEFTMTVPDKNTGRAMNDLASMAESFEGPDISGTSAVFKGRAAVSAMRGYASVLAGYTGGFGRLELSFGGYGNCRDADSIISKAAYEPELDADNPSGSVFCSHGAGYYVPWYEAGQYFHLDLRSEEAWLKGMSSAADEDAYTADAESDSGNAASRSAAAGNAAAGTAAGSSGRAGNYRKGGGTGRDAADGDYLGAGLKADKELEEIFYRSLGGNRGRNPQKAAAQTRPAGAAVRRHPESTAADTEHVEIKEAKKQYLLVDGYNVIFAWPELNEMSKTNIDGARLKLMDMLADYQGYRGMTLILVYDAYKVKGNPGSVEKYHNIYVVYTREAQTADAYIEKTVHEIGRRERVTVATSDGLEQTIVFGEGAVRMSSMELYEEVKCARQEMREKHIEGAVRIKNTMELPDRS